MAKLLWAFGFSEKRDEQGQVILVDVDAETGYSEGFLHCPKPFAAEIRPRSEGRRDTILKELEIVEKDIFLKYEVL